VLTEEHKKALDTDGYVVLERFLPPEVLTAGRDRVEELYTAEGENAGAEFRKEAGARRLANLVDKGAVFEKLVAMPEVLELVGHVLHDGFKLSSFNARSTDPFCQDAQPLHCDAGALPDERGYSVCNTIWLLDDFTPQNGATRVIPGSQKWKQLPQNALADPAGKHPEEVLVLGPAGSVVVMNTHAWHGGTANLTSGHRRALHVFYCRNDKPQQQYQKKLLRAETQAHLTPELRRILALDDPLNDQLSSAETGASGFLK
jgi:ectoine hydroxylase-related dioxygenase (phytanoyl-CoA dioxygenase family)